VVQGFDPSQPSRDCAAEPLPQRRALERDAADLDAYELDAAVGAPDEGAALEERRLARDLEHRGRGPRRELEHYDLFTAELDRRSR
jgi:hypothetical protein